MLLPIGDEPNESGFPLVNYALIAANAFVFIVLQRAGAAEQVVERYAYVPAAPSVLTAFTSMFLHGDWMHLIGNMLFLWIFGDNVEARLGRAGYLCAYLATGLMGGFVHGLTDPSSAIPSLGASGAISGVQGLYVVAFPRNRVKLLVLWYGFVRVFLTPAAWIVGFWFVVNDLLPFVTGKALLGGVAHGAHIGGFASGLVLCLALRPLLARGVAAAAGGGAGGRIVGPPQGRSGDPWILERGPSASTAYGRSSASRPVGAGLPSDADVLGLWRSGRPEAATAGLVAALRTGRRPTLPESDYLRMALDLESKRRFPEAQTAFEGFLGAYPVGVGAPLAHLGLGLILAKHAGDPEAARRHLASAAAISTDPRVVDAAQRALDDLGG